MSSEKNRAKLSLKRISVVIAAALVLLCSSLIPAFESVSDIAPAQNDFSSSAATISTAPESTLPEIAAEAIRNFVLPSLPDIARAEEGRKVAFTEEISRNGKRTFGTGLTLLKGTGHPVPHILSRSFAVFFADGETPVSHLYIIQYLHDQDGLKG